MWRKYAEKIFSLLVTGFFDEVNLKKIGISAEEIIQLERDLAISNEKLLAEWERDMDEWRMYGAPADPDGYLPPAYPEPKKPKPLTNLGVQLAENITEEILSFLREKWETNKKHVLTGDEGYLAEISAMRTFYEKEFAEFSLAEQALFIMKGYKNLLQRKDSSYLRKANTDIFKALLES